MAYTVAKSEQETTIIVQPGVKKAIYYSCVPRIIERIRKWAKEMPEEVEIVWEDRYGVKALIPAKWVRVKPPRRYSEEQRQAMAERLNKSPISGNKTDANISA